jgi:hypothetical protein
VHNCENEGTHLDLNYKDGWDSDQIAQADAKVAHLDAQRASRLVKDAYPEFGGQIVSIAEDWMGRQFAVRLPRVGFVGAQVLLFEPGSGDAYELDCGLRELFESELENDPVTYLALDLYREWREADSTPLSPGKCVGFKVPLFLGGSGSVDNLEISDVQVYWDILGQLRAATRDSPPGSKITGVQID